MALLPIWHLVFLAKDVPGLPVPLPPPFSPPLFGLCGFSSSFALWLVVLCSLPFPLSLSCSLLCLDFLTKDCQGFQLIVSLSFPLIAPFSLTAACAALFGCRVSICGFGRFLFLLFRVKVLELPGQRRVRFFNTRPFPPFLLVCGGWVGVLCSVLCVGLSWLLSVLVVLLWVFLLFVDFAFQY